MSRPTRLTKSLPGVAAVVLLMPDGDLGILCEVTSNGQFDDCDYVELASTAERDAALAKTVAQYLANGYQRIEDR